MSKDWHLLMPPKRLIYLFLILAVLIIIPFIIWGETFENYFKVEELKTKLEDWGIWAWLIAIGLFISDIFLPIPTTPLLTALGLFYGPFVGGTIGFVGVFLSGLVAYLACRLIGEKAAVWIVGDKDLERSKEFFSESGGWAVALSKWMPVLPEAIACLAGISRMPFKKFVIALACGSLPFAYTYAYFGHLGGERPVYIVMTVSILPLLFWLIAVQFFRRKSSKSENEIKE